MELRNLIDKLTLMESDQYFGRGIYSSDIKEEDELPVENDEEVLTSEEPQDTSEVHSLAKQLIDGEITEEEFLSSIQSFVHDDSDEVEPLSTEEEPEENLDSDDQFIRHLRESYGKKRTVAEGCNPDLEECADMEESEEPQNNVKMTIDGQGVDGIRDLLNLLSTKDSSEQPSDDIMFGGSNVDDVEQLSDSFQNGIEDENYFNVDDITKMGDDIHSKGNTSFPKQSGGDNAMNIREGLLKLYQELKNN